jgi:WD40 repeat protein
MPEPVEPFESDPTAYKYWGFLSYSHADERWAQWLHRAIERYTVPRALVGGKTSLGARPARLTPVFRDREELASSGDLSREIRDALRQSRFLIVVCSPRAAVSRWVDEEIKAFKAIGRADRVLAFIVDGEPHGSDRPDEGLLEAFPRALRFDVDADGAITSTPAEPLAADARQQGDGRPGALLKLLAGMLQVGFDDLRHREKRRRRRRMLGIGLAAAAATVALGTGWMNRQNAIRRQETINAAQRLAGESLQAAGLPGTDPSSGALLAVESLRKAATPDGVSAAVASLALVPRRLAELHAGGSVTHLAFSADNKTLVSASEDQVRVWDLVTRRQVSGLTAGGFVSALAVSPDGTLIASATIGSIVRVWDRRSGAERVRLEHGDTVESVSFDALGRIVTEHKGRRRMWNAQRGTPLDVASAEEPPAPSPNGVNAASLGGGSRWQLKMSGTTVSVVDRVTGREVGRLLANGWATSAAASPDGRRLAAGDDDGVVRVWESGAAAGVTLQHEALVVAASMNGDGSVVATSIGRGGVRVWDVATGRERQLLSGSASGVLALSPDGRVIASARGGYDSEPDTIVIGDAVSGQVLHRFRLISAVREMVFSPDGKRLTTRSERTLSTFEMSSGTQLRAFTGDDEIASFAIDANGHALALASANKVSLWDAASGQRGITLPFDGVVAKMAFSADGTTLATMSGSGVRLSDATRGTLRSRLLHDAIVRGLAFDPRRERLATFTDTHARLWSMDGAVRMEMPHKETILAGAVTDGGIVATLTTNAVHVWNTDEAREVATLPVSEELQSLRFSDDGRLLLAAVGGRIARILPWRPEDLVYELCQRLTRNMTENEWAARFSGEAYRRSCENLPPGTTR